MTEVMLAYNGKVGIDSNVQYNAFGGWKTITPQWNWTMNDYRIDPSTTAEYAETIRRQTIEKSWNGKVGKECNIEMKYIHSPDEAFIGFKKSSPSWDWERIDYRIKPLKV